MALGSKSKTTNFNTLSVKGKEISDPKEIANAVNSHFCTTAKRVWEQSMQSQIKNATDVATFESFISQMPKTTKMFKFRKVTPGEVMKAIAKPKNSRAGVIPSRFLKDASSRIAFPLASIFSESLEIGVFPDNLKLARISAIFKGKGSRSNPDHYRPISVLSVIARLFEKIVHQQLCDFLKESLSFTQSGFKPGCSTETSLLNTTNRWILNINKKYLYLTPFLDLRKAFDTVAHEILIQKMDFYGIKGIELAWFKSYLSNRMQYYCIDGTNSDYKVNVAGVPQGSCLGPLLFLIYINDLPSVLQNSDYNLYADDTNISTAEELLLKAQENLNTDIKTPEQWLGANKLSPNLVKTEYMIIASSPKLKHINFSPLIKLAGKPIKRVLKTDYLGLIIDEKLSWVDYVSTLTKKISSAVAAIKNVNFLPHKTLITLYQSLVESRLRYCNIVWGNCGRTLKNKLQSLQNRSARVVTQTKYGCVEPDQLLKYLRWLNVQQLIDFDTAVMVHKSINNKAHHN